jgi:hypothetical protein
MTDPDRYVLLDDLTVYEPYTAEHMRTYGVLRYLKDRGWKVRDKDKKTSYFICHKPGVYVQLLVPAKWKKEGQQYIYAGKGFRNLRADKILNKIALPVAGEALAQFLYAFLYALPTNQSTR